MSQVRSVSAREYVSLPFKVMDLWLIVELFRLKWPLLEGGGI